MRTSVGSEKDTTRLQCHLVHQSERAHEQGLRARGISGQICERLLTSILRRRFPRVAFDSGVVKLTEKATRLEQNKDLSNQVDIIAYRGKPSFKMSGFAVVPKRQVLCVFEVKKWTSPSDMTDPKKYNRQIAALRSSIRKPVLLVTFRHHHGSMSKESLVSHSRADYTYVFSKSTGYRYPWQVKHFESRGLYRGELHRLLRNLGRILS